MNKNLILILAYNAEKKICQVLQRIPKEAKKTCDILILDDHSADGTTRIAKEFVAAKEWDGPETTVWKTPSNQGYGGNQKLGYQYAIEESYENVIMVHGDGQYAPELVLELLRPLEENKADCVLGSRMINKKDALKGKMPLYKWVGNQVLTGIENFLLGTHLAEFHTGYRAYKTELLKKIPFRRDSDGFHFDSEILIQCVRAKARIEEIAIPTFYGDEKCHVDGIAYAIEVTKACLKSKLQDFGIYYDKKYDFGNEVRYDEKLSMESSHTAALREIPKGAHILDLGCGPGFILQEAMKQGAASALGLEGDTENKEGDGWKILKHDLKVTLPPITEVDTVLLLDVLEHIPDPDAFLTRLRVEIPGENLKIILTTPNIAFLPMRISLLFGQFNYGKFGILDKTHTRLFTFRSLKEILKQNGFQIEKMAGVPAPFEKALGKNAIGKTLSKINTTLCKIFPKAASYQILAVAKIKKEEHEILDSMRAQ